MTETVLVADLARAATQLAPVRALGVRVAVDDFGAGFTSLAHLRSLPIDEIRIDRSFVRGLPGPSDDRSLIAIVCDLARHLGVPTVAEGVEIDAQREVLEAIGRDALRGYLFSPALRPDAPARVGRGARGRGPGLRRSRGARHLSAAGRPAQPSRSSRRPIRAIGTQVGRLFSS